METRKVGRPVTVWTPEYLEEIRLKIEKYTEESQIPILAEFAYQNDILREDLYSKPELSYALKRLIGKKEAQLEKGTLSGALNPSMAIFSLKQIGWKDRQELEHSGNLGVTIVDDLK